MNILMQTSHSYSSIKKEPDKKKQRKAFTAMNILPFLDPDSGPFFFRAIQIIAADKIQQGQFPRISSHQDIKKNKNLNRLDTILH